MDVGNLEEIIDDNHAIVSTRYTVLYWQSVLHDWLSHGSKHYVRMLSFVDKDQLEPGCSVLLNHKVSSTPSSPSSWLHSEHIARNQSLHVLTPGARSCRCPVGRHRPDGGHDEAGESSNRELRRRWWTRLSDPGDQRGGGAATHPPTQSTTRRWVSSHRKE